MSGKWHSGHDRGELPVERGFDRYWGLVDGGSNYFNPGLRRPGEPEPVHKVPSDHRFWGDDERLIKPFTPDDPDFYITDSFSERAVSFLDRYAADERPFLLYLAYTAPHFPLQAPPRISPATRAATWSAGTRCGGGATGACSSSACAAALGSF